MNKILLLLMILYSCCAVSQNINKDILTKVWNANWIDVPGIKPHDYGVYHFRKNFLLDEQPKQFIIHVSADNR